MEDAIATIAVEEVVILPADDESNRLGDVVFSHDNGEVRRHIRESGVEYHYAWPLYERRGYRKNSFDEAMQFMKIRKPLGCADWEGTVKLGRCIERGPLGEVWKHNVSVGTFDMYDYYVWMADGTDTKYCHNLSEARELVGIVIQDNTPKTPPKTAYAQNNKGYKAGSK